VPPPHLETTRVRKTLKMDVDRCECYEAFDEDTGAPIGEFTCDSCHVSNGDCACDQKEMCEWCEVRPKEIVLVEESNSLFGLETFVGYFEKDRIDFEKKKSEGAVFTPCKKDSRCMCESCVFSEKIDVENVDRYRLEKWMKMSHYNEFFYWRSFCFYDYLEIVLWFKSWKADLADHLDTSKWFNPHTLSKVWIAQIEKYVIFFLKQIEKICYDPDVQSVDCAQIEKYVILFFFLNQTKVKLF
jgi:hypothetical protein